MQIADTIQQINAHNPNKENHDDESSLNQLKMKMNRLVENVNSWDGQVGIVGCHEPAMKNGKIEFCIYPVSFYDLKGNLGNRRNKNVTKQVYFNFS